MEINTSCNESGIKDETTRSGADGGSGSISQATHVHKVTVMLCAKPGEGKSLNQNNDCWVVKIVNFNL